MKVPLLDLSEQLAPLANEIERAVNEVIRSNRYVMGPKAEELEREIAAYCGTKYAVAMSSGTDALLACLMALGVGHGDVVITTPFSFFATAGVIARTGATPAFVDIDADTYNLSAAALKEWFNTNEESAEKLRAIIPVHLYGQCADMDPIMEMARERDVPVIEDAAQAIGAGYPSKDGLKKAASMGLAGCLSFFPTKNLGGMGDGGMVVTNDESFATTLYQARNHGAHSRYEHGFIGGNFRLDEMQAAVLLVKLKHLESWHQMRRDNAAVYDKGLGNLGLKTPEIAYDREHHIYHQYVVACDRRDALREFLVESDIGAEVYYPLCFHEQECFQYLDIPHGTYPLSEKAASSVLALPIYAELTTEMLDYVVERITAFA